MKMNGYERINAALKGIMPDWRPVMLHNFMPAVREAGYTMKEYRTSPEIAAECHIRFVEKYGVDGVLFDVDTAILASAAGVPVDYPDDDPARTHGMFLHSLDEIDIIAETDISSHPRIQHSLETVRLLKQHFKNEVYIRGNCDQAPFSLACCMRTPEHFMMDLIMDEERCMRLLQHTTRICLQFIRLMAQTGADMVSNGDSPAGPSMISPDMYARFAFPFEQQLVHEAHQHGLPYLLHICGDTHLILEQMNRLELDAVELDYKTPIEAIHEVFQQRTTLFGTVDPSGVLALGSPEMVRKEANRILDTYRGNPRLVLGAGCALPPGTPEENMREIIRAAHNVTL
jgi:uroporphyrinogen decarboxylase